MVQAIARSKARLTERQQFWLDHLRVCREQAHAEGICKDPWTVGQWAVHRATRRSRRARDPSRRRRRRLCRCASPLRGAAFRVPAQRRHRRVPAHVEDTACQVLDCASRLMIRPSSQRFFASRRDGCASSRSISESKSRDLPPWCRTPWRWTRSRRSSLCSPIAGAPSAGSCTGKGAGSCCGKSAWSVRASLGRAAPMRW